LLQRPQVVVGVDVEADAGGKVRRWPFAKVEENAFGVRLERGRVSCVYQL